MSGQVQPGEESTLATSHEVQQPAGAVTGLDSRYAEEVWARTQDRVRLIGVAGDSWRFAASLKSVIEDVAQEYAGRAVLELIQNGHDAIERGVSGRIHVLLDLSGQPALYVANDGRPFGTANFNGIIDLGLSPKGAGEGIGNKGLGFRSVLLLTDCPEVYSRDPEDPQDRSFSGYSFRFPAVGELAGLTVDPALGKRLTSEASPLNLPVPATVIDPQVLRFAGDGFATVIKLPLRDEVAVAEAREQMDSLAAEDAPILLFLDRISVVELAVRSATGQDKPVRLGREQRRVSLLAEAPGWISEVDLGTQGRYLLARRQVDHEALMQSIQESVNARLVDDRWLEWNGEESVGVAVPLGKPPGQHLIYTFLPTQEESPLSAHVHAPFFTKLARRDVKVDVPLNAFLMGEIAATCLELLRALRDGGDRKAVAPVVVDLATWREQYLEYLANAFAAAGATLADDPFLPVAAQRGWASVRDCYVLPARGGEPTVITAATLAALGYPLLDPGIGKGRLHKVARLRDALLKTAIEPEAELLAEWVEALARHLQSAGTAADTWAAYYDDLAILFRDQPNALRGKAIILDQDSRLRHALGAGRAERRSRQLFFPPAAGDADGHAAPVRMPPTIATRISFTRSDLPWNIGETGRQRPGRTFLQGQRLVREYRTDEVLEALGEMLRQHPDEAVRAEALEFAFTLYPDLTDKLRKDLANMPFSVPTATGQWVTASDATFSGAWKTPGGQLLEQLLSFATGETPDLLALREQLIAAPEGWPARVRDRGHWVSFLRTIGVQDGLPLSRIPRKPRNGSYLDAAALGPELGLDSALTLAWDLDVRARWDGGTHPHTQYSFSSRIPVLPGTAEVEGLPGDAREIFARLIALGMASWPGDAFEVTVLRAERYESQQDRHRWPTPVSSYIRHGNWLPTQGARDGQAREFVRPGDAWLSGETSAPGFVPLIQPSLRKALAGETAQARLRAAGVRVWDDPAFCGLVLKELAAFLDEGRVAPHEEATLRKQNRLAWERLAQDPGQWTWTDDETPPVVVTIHDQLRALRLGPGAEVIVPDEPGGARQALFALTDTPMLVVSPECGQRVAALLRDRRLAATLTSELPIKVVGDNGHLITAVPDHPALLDDGRQGAETVIALVAELKAGSFTRHTAQSIHQLLDRARQIRLLRAESVRLFVGDEEITPAGHTRSLPIEDKTAPTIAFWGHASTPFAELDQCAESIAILVGQPQFSAELQLAFSRLASSAEHVTELTDTTLAHALQVSEAQIKESRNGLRGALFDVLDRVRLVLAYAAGPQAVAAFNATLPDVPAEGDIASALTPWEDALPIQPADLVLRCKELPTLADLRDDLALNLASFNEVLRQATPPRPPLRYPDRHAHAIEQYIASHRNAITDRLRETFLPVARAGGDLAPYARARSLDSLTPDPAWLDEYANPPEQAVATRVSQWLAGQGAPTDLSLPTTLPGLSELRSRNASALEQMVQAADTRVRAWTRTRGAAVPEGWNAPVVAARAALEQSCRADFFELGDDELLELIADSLGWPSGMRVTLDLTLLGMEQADLLSQEEAASAERSRRRHERTHLDIDGHEVPVADEHDLRRLADAISAGITDGFLGQTGKGTLAEVTTPNPTPSRSYGGGIPVARARQPSAEQRTAIGLIGEVAAKAWLERHYENVEWVSEYRNIVLGGTKGSDNRGYDFIARRSGGRPVYFEVKALSDPATHVAQFELGATEVREAQEHGNAYRILLVTSARDSATRRIVDLPNPLGRQGAGRYTLVGRGLRYQCSFISS